VVPGIGLSSILMLFSRQSFSVNIFISLAYWFCGCVAVRRKACFMVLDNGNMRNM
jgi:hypothetical protein